MKYIINKELCNLGLKNLITTKGRNFKLTDDKNIVIQNVKCTLKEASLTPLEVFSVHQTHSNNIAIVDSLQAGEEFVYGRYFRETDGLITNLKNVMLITKFADCTPILLFDVKNRVQANIHSGWRGTALKISQVALEKMKAHFGTNPKDIYAYIGPTIGGESFEVESDVVNIYKAAFDFAPKIISRKSELKYNIDLELTNILSLVQLGIPKENIFSQHLCTYSTDYLYSYRRDGEKYCLMAMMSIIL